VGKFTKLAGAGNLFDGDMGMKQQQPQQLAAHIAAAADDTNSYFRS
jgi:hypothetical protein